MWDILLIAVTIAFFAVAIAYAHACEWLGRKGGSRD
jgi:hypothetical protein